MLSRPVPLHHVRGCKQANNNSSLLLRASHGRAPLHCEGNCSLRSSMLQNICFFIVHVNNTSPFPSLLPFIRKKKGGRMKDLCVRCAKGNYLWWASFLERKVPSLIFMGRHHGTDREYHSPNGTQAVSGQHHFSLE